MESELNWSNSIGFLEMSRTNFCFDGHHNLLSKTLAFKWVLITVKPRHLAIIKLSDCLCKKCLDEEYRSLKNDKKRPFISQCQYRLG